MRTTPRPEATPLGDYIQAKRCAAGLSQTALAEALRNAGLTSTSQGGVSGWENNGIVPGALSITALARVLPGASVEEMLALVARQEAAEVQP